MSDFDPYYKWLGIPPQEQPPNHYRLLGVQMLEQNAEVIEAAANRQMAYLQELSSGDDHVDEAQRLLGEVARARVCLLAAESKVRYDAELVSTLDSLPEAEEEASAPQAEPIVNASRTPKPSSARRSSSTARRKTTSGSRGHSSGSKKSTSRKKINTGDSTKESSSLAIKIVAAVVPAVLVLIIGVILMSGGGGGKNKANNISNPETAGRSSQSDAGKGVPRSTEAEKKKADRDLEKRLARLKNQRPKPTKPPKSPEPKPDKPEASETKSTPPESADAVDTEATELSETEKAEALLKGRGLEEGFNSQWKLTALKAQLDAAEKTTETSSFEPELRSRVEAKKRAILARWAWLNTQPADNGGPLDQEYNRTAGWIVRTNQGLMVKDNAKPIIDIRAQLEAEYANQPLATNEVTSEIASQLRDKYAELTKDPKVQEALAAVGGNLAEAPKVPEAAGDTPEQTVSLHANDTNAPQEPVANYEELKGQLTALEKKTKLSLGSLTKGAKEYIKQKKELVKRIKKGEGMIAKRSKLQDSLPDGEQKRKFGLETEAKYIKPLKDLKAKLENLPKPVAETRELEEKLKQAEKLVEQLKASSEYAANPKSIDSLAEKIANYRNGRNGYEVQQTKMAK